jgi:fucose permease
VLLFTLSLWDRVAKLSSSSIHEKEVQESDFNKKPPSLLSILKVKGVLFTLLACLFYCGIENTFGLWGSSFLIKSNGVGEATAATWVSLFFGSLAAGRFLSGFISMKIGDKGIIRIGETTILIGALILIIPAAAGSITGIILLGMGCAPLFPSLIHQTPSLFGKQNAHATVSLQVGMAYVGSTFIPPIFGFAATGISMHIFPFFILACAAALIISSEKLNATVHKGVILPDNLNVN